MSSCRFHVVILEDNEPDLLMLKHSIRDAGLDCDITAFSDGGDAVTYVNDRTSRIPDLMILDCNVPRVAGASVLNSVRGSPRWAGVGVFIFTGSQDPADAARLKLLGADDCLIKPMNLAGFAKIGQAVREWLGKK